jgi:hypothetical protein
MLWDTPTVIRTREKLFLVVEAWPPRQITANIKAFTLNVASHIFGEDTFRWFGVVHATGCMDVMITTPPSVFGRFYPRDWAVVERGAMLSDA